MRRIILQQRHLNYNYRWYFIDWWYLINWRHFLNWWYLINWWHFIDRRYRWNVIDRWHRWNVIDRRRLIEWWLILQRAKQRSKQCPHHPPKRGHAGSVRQHVFSFTGNRFDHDYSEPHRR